MLISCENEVQESKWVYLSDSSCPRIRLPALDSKPRWTHVRSCSRGYWSSNICHLPLRHTEGFELGGLNNRRCRNCPQRSFCFPSDPAIHDPHGHVSVCSDLTPHHPPRGSFPHRISESTTCRSCHIHREAQTRAHGLCPSSPPSQHAAELAAGMWETSGTDPPRKPSFPDSKTSYSIPASLINPKARTGILYPMDSLQALKDLQNSSTRAPKPPPLTNNSV